MDRLIVVIFGGSGDLTKRKLIPALFDSYRRKRMPEDFTIMGVGRTNYTKEEYQAYIRKEMDNYVPSVFSSELKDGFTAHLSFLSMNPADTKEYTALAKRFEELKADDPQTTLLYYLATPPSLYSYIPQALKQHNLNRKNSRIVVEKPFGYNLEESRKLNAIYADSFDESQIYRIDHFLGKETAQNILAFRFANSIFEPVWNRNFIDYIEITAVENMGIEKRGGYYDKAGALRDMVQNHLIQLVALTAMEPPIVFDADGFRNEVVKVYKSLKPLDEKDMANNVIRGQYIASDNNKAYREEAQIDPDSRTETFVAMKLEINNWRWKDVPFFIRTGKSMPTKVTEIVVHFKETPYALFNCSANLCHTHNVLIFRIQPSEGIALKLGVKEPGNAFQITDMPMSFTYDSIPGEGLTDAYSKLIEDCIHGDQTLFTRSDAIEASWSYFDPLLKYWEENKELPLYGYPFGTWGPLESKSLIEKYSPQWTNPCKNLTNSNLYCEL